MMWKRMALQQNMSGIFGGGNSSPPPPPPPPAPAPVAPTADKAATEAATTDATVANANQQKANAAGYSSTILTSGQGATESQDNAKKKTLLGGD